MRAVVKKGVCADKEVGGLVFNEKKNSNGVSLNENTERCDPRKAFLHLKSPGQEGGRLRASWHLRCVDLSTYRKTDVEYNWNECSRDKNLTLKL